MATSGTNTVVCTTNSQYYLKLNWARTSVSIPNNQSTIDVSFYVGRYSPYYDSARDLTAGDNTCNITADGQNPGNWYVALDTRPLAYNALGYDNESYLGTRSFTINHNSDGTKTFTISASLSCLGAGGLTGTNYISMSATLDTIPRGSVIGTISAFNVEDSFSVPVTKYSDSFTDTLEIKLGTTVIKTITPYTNNAAITLTDAEILAAYNAQGANLTSSFTFKTSTYSGATLIGTDEKTANGTDAGTGHIKVSGTWKRALPYIKVSGAWKKAIALIKVNTEWKRGKI